MRRASRLAVSRAPVRVQGRGCAALALLLGGCALPQSASPVDWWHQAEGGPIAAARPPPPNADAPYPKLASIPAKPPAPDSAGLTAMSAALLADRGSAQYAAKTVPIPTLPPPVLHPEAMPAPPAAAEDDSQSNASLAAASAPPASVTSAPSPSVAAPSAPPPSAQPPSAPPPSAPPPSAPAPVAVAPAAATAGDVVMPDLPAAPPAPPQIAGVSVASVTAPVLPPVPPPAPPPAPLLPGVPVAIPFPPGSAILPAAGHIVLTALAKTRGARVVAITGYGDAPPGADPSQQTSALPLGFDRARAVAADLATIGVPASSVRLAAEPQGGGASARLTN